MVMEYKSGIYQIRNILDGKIYVGSAKNLKTRWTTHLWALRSKKHFNIHLQRAFDKYGENSFIFEILYTTNNVEELIKKEDVIEIRKMLLLGQKGKDVTKMFNISPQGVSNIKLGKVWKNV
jgi:group I intron endonuclease